MKKLQLNQDLSDKLKKYSALGSAFMLTAGATQANIVFTDIPDVTVTNPGTFAVDIDGDATTDVTIRAGSGWSGATAISAIPAAGNSLIGSTSSLGVYQYPFVLASGDPVSAGQAFNPAGTQFNTLYSTIVSAGNWPPPTSGFIGVRFLIGADVHFGWIQLSVNSTTEVVVEAFGYDDTPLTTIAAGAMPPVPTLSEWGLITLSLFLMSFGTIFVARREGALGMAGGTADMGGLSWVFRRPPFFAAAFKKALLATGVLTALLGLFSMVAYGGITAVDFFGAMVAAPVFAYLMHLMMVYEKEAKRRINGE